MVKNKRSLACFICFVAFIVLTKTSFAAEYLIKDGKPMGEIVIRENPLRTVLLAAWELQNHLEKISGVILPIVHKPGPGLAHVFIGSSEHTKALGIDNKGLENGAYRIVSGNIAIPDIDEKSEPAFAIRDSNDPFHQVLGRKPMKNLPWYFNIGRRRPRGEVVEMYSYSPTNSDELLVPERFAKLAPKK